MAVITISIPDDWVDAFWGWWLDGGGEDSFLETVRQNQIGEHDVSCIIKGRTSFIYEEIIEDGHGGMWSAWCPECDQKTMEVVRPGKVQCSECGH